MKTRQANSLEVDHAMGDIYSAFHKTCSVCFGISGMVEGYTQFALKHLYISRSYILTISTLNQLDSLITTNCSYRA